MSTPVLRVGRHVVTAGLVVGVFATSARAAITWDGDVDGDIANPGNWVGNPDPDLFDDGILEDGDLIFTGGVNTTVIVDIDYTNIDSITFDGGADAFTLEGDGGGFIETLEFNDGGTITNQSANLQTFGSLIDISFTGTSATISNSGGGSILFQSDIDISDTGGVDLAVTGNGDVTFDGVIGGAGGQLTWSGTGTLTLNAANTFTGGVTASDGTILLGDAAGLGTGTLSITGNVILGATGGPIAGVTNDISVAGGQILTIGGSENLDLEGVISGAGSVVINMDDVSDQLTLAGDNSGLGGFTLTEGTVLVEHANALGGVGDTLTVNAAAGDASIEASGGPITLNTNILLSGGASQLTIGGKDDIGLAGVISGAGSLVVGVEAGDVVTLSGANTFSGGLIISAAGSVIALDHDTALGSGTLSLLTDGEIRSTNDARNVANAINLGTRTLTIGGTNDLTLGGAIAGTGDLVIDMGAGDVLTLAGASTFSGGVTLNSANTIVAFGNDAALGSGTFTLGADGTVRSTADGRDVGNAIALGANTLTIDGANDLELSGVISGTGDLDIAVGAGDVVTLSGASTFSGGVTISSADAVLAIGDDDGLGSGSLTLGADAELRSTNDARVVGNDIALGANTLTVGGTSNLRLTGVITGTGDLEIAMGANDVLRIDGVNFYTGTTTLTSGVLQIGNDSAIGNGGGGANLVINGGTLDAVGNRRINEAVTIGGDFAVADLGGGSLELSGTIGLGNADRTITTNNDEVFELSGVISSTGQDDALIKAGTGVLLLSADNSAWNGGVQLNAGTLGLGDDDALGGAALEVGGTAFLYADGGTRTISNDIDLNSGALTITGTEDFVLSGVVSAGGGGGGSLTIASNGTTTLSGVNTHDGGTTLQSGTVIVTNDDSIGTGTLGLAGGTLTIGGTGVSFGNAVSITGASTIDGDQSVALSGNMSGAGALTIDLTAISDVVTLSGTNTFSADLDVTGGMLTLAGGSAIADDVAIQLADDATVGLTLSASEAIAGLIGGGATGGHVTLGASTLTLAGDGATVHTYDGVISGTGGVSVTGGSHAITADQTFTGTFAQSGGTVNLSGALAGDMTVSGGDLTMGGDVAGDATVSGGDLMMTGDLTGDLVQSSGDLTMSGAIAGNMTTTGGTATVSGPLTGDWSMGGGTVAMSGTVGGDLTMTGGTANVTGAVTGHWSQSGGLATMSDSIGGDLNLTGGRFDLGPESGTFTVAVAGDVSVTNATLGFTVPGTNPAVVDRLQVTGDVAFGTGAAIQVEGTQAPGGYIATGSTFEIITANEITGLAEILTDSATLDFVEFAGFDTPDYDPGDSSLRIVASRIIQTYTQPGVIIGPNNLAIGAVFDELSSVADANPLGSAGDLLAQIQVLNAEELNFAMSRLTPTAAAESSNVAVARSVDFHRNQSTYLEARRQGTELAWMTASATSQAGFRAARAWRGDGDQLAENLSELGSVTDARPVREADRTWRMHARVQGSDSSLDTAGLRVGYSGTTYGVQGGLDRRFESGLLVGLALGFQQSDADLRESRGDLDSDEFRLGPYLTYAGDGWYVDASMSYGLATYDQRRNIAIPGMGVQVARSDYDGDDLTGYLGGGIELPLGETWVLAPNAAIQFSRYSFDQYAETGAGVNNLIISGRDTDSLRGRAGLRIARRDPAGPAGGGVRLLPDFSVGWEQEFEDPSDVEATFAIGGSPFLSDVGASPGGGIFAGAGVTLRTDGRWSASVRYDGLFGDEVERHAVTGFVRYEF